ncbi:PD-(D/E)XK nuclease family protein [Paraconexibacter sp.]|uniref:PD-(D/E)XK nuclease family protein n=1 Tax=Paraconexibacter sp. TaxID=2949640 RepID=UPI0035614A77
MINEIPGLGRAVVEFLDSSSEPRGAVCATTQFRVARGFVDLVLIDEDALEVWVEVKDRAGESGEQLSNYQEALARRGTHERQPRLVYLNRLGAHRATPSNVPTHRWQGLAAHLARWLQAAVEISPQHVWLLNDYLAYLKERGLAMTEPIPTDARAVVERQWQLWETLETLHDLVSERLESLGWARLNESWAQKKGGSIKVWPGEWWSVYRAQPADRYPACDFEAMLVGLTPEDADGVPTFSAGLVWRSDRASSNPIADLEWRERLQTLSRERDASQPFQPCGGGESKLHLRVPVDTLAAPSLAEQAEAMVEVAHDAFAMLRELPPPVAPT